MQTGEPRTASSGAHRAVSLPRAARASSPSREHDATELRRPYTFGGLASPPSSCSPPRTRAPTITPSSPRVQVESGAGQHERESMARGSQDSGNAAEAMLQEKEEIIAALKSQLEVRAARGSHARGDPPEAGEMLERVAEAEGANDALRERLREVTGELAAVREERTTLLQLQEMLEAATPDATTLAEAARVRERAHAASREETVRAHQGFFQLRKEIFRALLGPSSMKLVTSAMKACESRVRKIELGSSRIIVLRWVFLSDKPMHSLSS